MAPRTGPAQGSTNSEPRQRARPRAGREGGLNTTGVAWEPSSLTTCSYVPGEAPAVGPGPSGRPTDRYVGRSGMVRLAEQGLQH